MPPPVPLRAFTATTLWMTLPALLTACSKPETPPQALNEKPAFLRGDVHISRYDGEADDLLTAGLGKTGLSREAPTFADPAAPTVTELRRLAIYTNYRAVLDHTAAGGFGRLYGPNIDIKGQDALGEGRIPGTEYLALADDGTGTQNIVFMVQVPSRFDPGNACIVTGTSSGSRGIYGAIGSAGEWGLKHGCAVAYTDKGTGNGLHDLMSNATLHIDGRLADAQVIGHQAHFRAPLDDTQRAAFNAAFPHRVAYKHAHSQQHPEKDWGKHTLQAVQFAFYALNLQFSTPGADKAGAKPVHLHPGNTLVMASSISNGGGAALAAAEQDAEGLIDGLAVAEPNAPPGSNSDLTIQQGRTTIPVHSKPLADYITFANLYQPCAALSARAGLSISAPLWPETFTAAARNRCAALHHKGLLNRDTLPAQADEALKKLQGYGWQSEHDFLQASHYRLTTNPIAVTYVNALGRFQVTDNLCGYSFANTDSQGQVSPQDPTTQAALFGTGNGIPPTSGINIVYNLSVGGPKQDFLATSPSSKTADLALDGALCLRALVTGVDPSTGASLAGQMKADSERVREGLSATLLNANLQGKPGVIVAGRHDALLPVNHNARAYYGKNQGLEGASSQLKYMEVTHAQHFDAFIALGSTLGYDERFVPLHLYYIRAMDALWQHLKHGEALPPSQVVRTTTRGPQHMLEPTHVPPFTMTPEAQDEVIYSGGVLRVGD